MIITSKEMKMNSLTKLLAIVLISSTVALTSCQKETAEPVKQDNMENLSSQGSNSTTSHKLDRNKCFKIVFPIRVVLKDSSRKVLKSYEDLTRLRKWCKGDTNCFRIVYPIKIQFAKNKYKVLKSPRDLRRAFEYCKKLNSKKHPSKDKCFRYVFPLKVKLSNGKIVVLKNYQELMRLKKSCKSTKCFRLMYPYKVQFSNKKFMLIRNAKDLKKAYMHCNKFCKDKKKCKGKCTGKCRDGKGDKHRKHWEDKHRHWNGDSSKRKVYHRDSLRKIYHRDSTKRKWNRDSTKRDSTGWKGRK
jgi:hypothetical protein